MNSNTSKITDILIVEDDMNLNHLFSDIFTRKSFNVSYETTINSAKNNLINTGFHYDVVLLDYYLPDGKGDNLIEWLKLQAPDIPVILISVDNNNAIIIKCFKAGATDFITKPFDIQNVISHLEKVLQFPDKPTLARDKINAELYTTDWIEFTAASEIDYLGRIQKLCAILLFRKLDKALVNDIRLAMEEYGRNAIEWGNKFDKKKVFKISYCVFTDRIILKFEDEGEGFKLQDIPDPSRNPKEHLKLRALSGKRPGGYGIFMMKNIMDDVLYNEKGNVCVMTKYIPAVGKSNN